MQHPGYSTSGVIEVLLNHTDDERFLLAGESLCHSFGPCEVESPASKWCPSVSVALTQVMSKWQMEMTLGQLSMLVPVHLCLFYLTALMPVPGIWGREVVQDSISCGGNRVKERKKQISPSLCFCLVLGISAHSPSFLYCLYDRNWLLFLWNTLHTKEVLSFLFPKSLTFSVAWAGSLQVLPDFESQKQLWLSTVLCPPALYPCFCIWRGGWT